MEWHISNGLVFSKPKLPQNLSSKNTMIHSLLVTVINNWLQVLTKVLWLSVPCLYAAGVSSFEPAFAQVVHPASPTVQELRGSTGPFCSLILKFLIWTLYHSSYPPHIWNFQPHLKMVKLFFRLNFHFDEFFDDVWPMNIVFRSVWTVFLNLNNRSVRSCDSERTDSN